MAENILDLTLNIIYLLTGKSFPTVKSGEDLTIVVPPCHSLKPKGHNVQKILEAAQKIIQLLTEEGGPDEGAINSQLSYASFNPLKEAPTDGLSSYCKEEPLESTHNDLSSTDPTQHSSVSIKEDPDLSQGEAVMSLSLKSEEGSPLHNGTTMTGEYSPVSTQHSSTRFVSDEHSLEELEFSTQSPPSLVPQETSLEGELPDGDTVCLKWNVMGPQEDDKVNMHFPCIECGKSCRSKAELNQHCRIHSEENPFQSSECGKCFSQRSMLTMHHIIHTGQKPYTCSECGSCFTSKLDLTKHNKFHRHKIHIGDKEFMCSECGKSFITRSEMAIHQRIHTGENPHTCSECEKSFISSSDLVKHQRSHTGLRPHICPECGKSYVSRSVLTRHRKIHMVEKRFFCPECGMGFVRTGQFMAHVKSHRHS